MTAADATSGPAPRAGAGPLALVVDDSRGMRALIGLALRGLGFRVVEACDGSEGLDRLRETAGIVVALVDRNMPVMDGIGFLRAVRRLPEFDALKLMMVTTEADPARVAEAFEGGADAYVLKPFTAAAISGELGRLGVLSARS